MSGTIHPILAFMGLGATEIAVVLLVLVLFFGAAKIPQLAKSIGSAKGEFEKARRSVEKELAAGEREASAPQTPKKEEEEEAAVKS